MNRRYVSHQLSQSQTPYTFLYPANWQVRETVEEERIKVFIAGPRDPEDTFSVGFTVRISPAPVQTPAAAMRDLLERFQQMPGYRETGRSSGIVAGRPAAEAEFTHTMPLPLNAREPQVKTIRHRHITFLDSNDMLVELIYVAPDDMYDTWLPAFHTLVQTFRQTDVVVGESTAFHSLIGVPDAATVREATADYDVEEGAEGK